MSRNAAWSRGLMWKSNLLGTMRRPLTSTERLSSISRTRRRPSSIGRMLLLLERENTPSTIRSTPCSNDCNPMLSAHSSGLSPRSNARRRCPASRFRSCAAGARLVLATAPRGPHAQPVRPAAPRGLLLGTIRGAPLPESVLGAVGEVATVTWFHSGEWRNRQTRWLQVPVFARMWGFKSPLAHGKAPAQQGLLWSLDPLLLPHYRLNRMK